MTWDLALFHIANGSDSVVLDRFFFVLTSLYTWLPVAAVLLWIVFRNFTVKQALWLVVLIAVVIACSDQLTSSVLKPLVARFRPTHDPLIANTVDIVNNYRGGKYGFPSSHAANSFALLFFTVPLLRNTVYTVCMALWALLFCYSRVYLGVHFPTDIIVGMLIGALIGTIIYRIGVKGRNIPSCTSVRDIRIFIVTYALTYFVIVSYAVIATL